MSKCIDWALRGTIFLLHQLFSLPTINAIINLLIFFFLVWQNLSTLNPVYSVFETCIAVLVFFIALGEPEHHCINYARTSTKVVKIMLNALVMYAYWRSTKN